MKLEEAQRLMKTGDAARFLNVSPGTVYRLAQRGIVPSVRIGGSLRFDPRELDAWLHQQNGAPR
jgi:excisionase family DNA binding protein